METTNEAASTTPPGATPKFRPKRGVPEGLWRRCPGCRQTIFRKEAERQLGVCPECDYHWYVSAGERINQLMDEGTFEEWFAELLPTDPLGFADRKAYAERIKDEQARTGLSEAAVTGTGMVRARRVAFGVTDSAFIMGSMGSVVGEKLTRLVEQATVQNLPLIIVSGSGGGARMHEGILSLMQMAKVSAALARYHEAKGLFISVLTNPTMGRPARDPSRNADRVAQGIPNQRVSARTRLHRPRRPPPRPQERNRPHHRLLRDVVARSAARRSLCMLEWRGSPTPDDGALTAALDGSVQQVFDGELVWDYLTA
jgi:acetyl-CoA carboxylase carboxyl transferase subunit beta